MEAQRVISVSLGKIAQSRVQRAGCSLHKSLMVASILQKARHLYVEQAFLVHCRPTVPPPPPPPTMLCPPADDEPTYTDLDACSPARRGVAPPPKAVPPPKATPDAESARRKRLISDEETEEAVASILPKRARTDANADASRHVDDSKASADESKESSKDSDSDDSDDSCYESGDSDDSEADAMEIDRITSLVSVFSFDKLSRATASDACQPREWDRAADRAVAVVA